MAATLACFSSRFSFSLLFFWVASLGVGAIYLVLGVEGLAMVQWLVSTFTALILLLFSVMVGEYSDFKQKVVVPSVPFFSLKLFFSSFIIGIVFVFIFLQSFIHVPLELVPVVEEFPTLNAIGIVLTGKHFWSLEIFIFTLFLVFMGVDKIGRSKGREKE